MPEPESPILLRFEGFELDLHTRELRRDGRLVKLQDLPVKLLAMLAARPGELVTREEIEKELWGEDQFVDFEHGINTAMRKVRDALGEPSEQPRFIETLPRKGYRFIAPVEAVPPGGQMRLSPAVPAKAVAGLTPSAQPREQIIQSNGDGLPAGAPAPRNHDDFFLPRGPARGLFLLIQAGYLTVYCAALYKAESLQEVLDLVYHARSGLLLPVVLVLAMCGIAVRLYLLSSVGLDHPAAGQKYHRIFPALFVLDTLWAAAPLLLVRKIGFGLALAGVAALAYLPFAQRTLMQSSRRDALPNNSIGPAR